jgi:hypothetical protein
MQVCLGLYLHAGMFITHNNCIRDASEVRKTTKTEFEDMCIVLKQTFSFPLIMHKYSAELTTLWSAIHQTEPGSQAT